MYSLFFEKGHSVILLAFCCCSKGLWKNAILLCAGLLISLTNWGNGWAVFVFQSLYTFSENNLSHEWMRLQIKNSLPVERYHVRKKAGSLMEAFCAQRAFSTGEHSACVIAHLHPDIGQALKSFTTLINIPFIFIGVGIIFIKFILLWRYCKLHTFPYALPVSDTLDSLAFDTFNMQSQLTVSWNSGLLEIFQQSFYC